MKFLFSLCLMIISSCCVFAAGEEPAPIWHQGTVILIQTVSFIILVFCIYKFLFKPVSEEMEIRQKQIANAYKDAEDAKKFCEEKKAEYEEMLIHADEEVKAKLNEAFKEANAIKDAKIGEAAQEAKRRLELAENTIEKEKAKALFSLREESGKLGVQIASKILNKELNQENHKELIDNFIKDLD